jgi:hypothetical protein
MNLLATLLGKLLDPLLSMFLGRRFSLVELLVSNRSAGKAGRAEVEREVTEKAIDAITRAQAARRAVSDDPDSLRDDSRNRD